MNLNLTLIEGNPDKLKSDAIDDIDAFDNIVQNANIWHNDGHKWWYYYKVFVTCITKTIVKKKGNISFWFSFKHWSYYIIL